MKKRPHKGHYRVIMGIITIALLFGLSATLISNPRSISAPDFPVASER